MACSCSPHVAKTPRDVERQRSFAERQPCEIVWTASFLRLVQTAFCQRPQPRPAAPPSICEIFPGLPIAPPRRRRSNAGPPHVRPATSLVLTRRCNAVLHRSVMRRAGDGTWVATWSVGFALFGRIRGAPRRAVPTNPDSRSPSGLWRTIPDWHQAERVRGTTWCKSGSRRGTPRATIAGTTDSVARTGHSLRARAGRRASLPAADRIQTT